MFPDWRLLLFQEGRSALVQERHVVFSFLAEEGQLSILLVIHSPILNCLFLSKALKFTNLRSFGPLAKFLKLTNSKILEIWNFRNFGPLVKFPKFKNSKPEIPKVLKTWVLSPPESLEFS